MVGLIWINVLYCSNISFSTKKTLRVLYPYLAMLTANSKTEIKNNKHPIECHRFDADKK